jgi:hypothetical protein
LHEELEIYENIICPLSGAALQKAFLSGTRVDKGIDIEDFIRFAKKKFEENQVEFIDTEEITEDVLL